MLDRREFTKGAEHDHPAEAGDEASANGSWSTSTTTGSPSTKKHPAPPRSRCRLRPLGLAAVSTT
jgi:hypothetical protein